MGGWEGITNGGGGGCIADGWGHIDDSDMVPGWYGS